MHKLLKTNVYIYSLHLLYETYYATCLLNTKNQFNVSKLDFGYFFRVKNDLAGVQGALEKLAVNSYYTVYNTRLQQCTEHLLYRVLRTLVLLYSTGVQYTYLALYCPVCLNKLLNLSVSTTIYEYETALPIQYTHFVFNTLLRYEYMYCSRIQYVTHSTYVVVFCIESKILMHLWQQFSHSHHHDLTQIQEERILQEKKVSFLR